MFPIVQRWFLSVFISLVFLGESAFASPTLLALNTQDSIKLGGHVEYFVEQDHPLSLSELLQLNPASWQSTRPGYLMLGLAENVYWFRLPLISTTDKLWQLSLRYFFNCDAQIYLVPRGQTANETHLISTFTRWHQRHYSLPLTLSPGQTYDLYMRFGVPGPDKFALLIEDQDAKKKFDVWDNRWVGLFYGGFATMLLYNLFLAISTRSFTYSFYLLYLLSMLSYLLMMDGVVQAVLSRYYIAICAIVFFGCQFCRSFLRTSTTLPDADRFIKSVMASAILLALLMLMLGSLTLLTNLVMVLVAGYGMLLGGVGLLSRRRGNHVARFFLLAWVFPLVGMIYTDLMFMGIVPYTDVGYSVMNIVSLIEAIMLSMALADRINVLRTQRQRAVMEAKQKLEISNRALEKANRLKDSFLGTISHELRTPMNGIIGTLELLKTSNIDQHQKECITTLDASSVQMLAMVERILLFSELQSGGIRLQPSALNIQAWASQLEAQWAALFLGKGVQFHVRVGPLLSPWIMVDSKKLDSLVSELLSNAHKFSAQGEVWVDLQEVSDGAQLQWVLEIADSGIGIPADQLNNITESFRQGQSAYNRQYGGLGIGMAIIKEIIAAMLGQWTVDSTAGQGTRIRVVIPVLTAAAPVQPEPVRPATVTNVVTPENRRILVVEDNAVNQIVMKKILDSLGWEYRIANNGEEAVDAARDKPFALILMDCQMPVMDGFAATQAIRAGENLNARTPIVAVTANATDEDRDHCIAVGMNDYLKKPVKPRDISTIITRYVPAAPVDPVAQAG